MMPIEPSGSTALDHHARRTAQNRQQVGDRLLDPVHLARLQRRRRRCWVGHDDPLDAIEIGDLAAGGEVGRLVARQVAVEARVDRLRAGYPFVTHEAIRAAADVFGDLLIRIGARHPLGHHEADAVSRARRAAAGTAWSAGSAKRRSSSARISAICAARRWPKPSRLLQRLIEATQSIARTRLVVVEKQAVAQRERPGQLVVGDLVARQHLRLRLRVCRQGRTACPRSRSRGCGR